MKKSTSPAAERNPDGSLVLLPIDPTMQVEIIYLSMMGWSRRQIAAAGFDLCDIFRVLNGDEYIQRWHREGRLNSLKALQQCWAERRRKKL